MNKRHDYRRTIKEMNAEQLIKYIPKLKDNLLKAIFLWDTTKELDILCLAELRYAELHLKKLQEVS